MIAAACLLAALAAAPADSALRPVAASRVSAPAVLASADPAQADLASVGPARADLASVGPAPAVLAPADPAQADLASVGPAPADPASADPVTTDSAREADSREAAPAEPAASEAAAREAGSPAAGARLFETWELGADAGILLPAGRLARVLDPAPCLGFRLLSSYYGPWRAWGSIDLARLDGGRSPASVGMATGAAGLARQPSWASIPSPGIGLAYHYVRALRKDPSVDEYLFLEDGESEFGMRAVLRWSIPAGKRLALSAGARWDAMFTEPGYGHAFALHLGAAWTRR